MGELGPELIPILKPTVEVKPPVQEVEEPVENLAEKFDRIFYAREMVTGKSSIKSKENPDERIERPEFLRARRADLYKELRSLPKEDKDGRRRIIKEAHLRDEITRQYLMQSELSVTIPGLGEQRARCINITPPEPLQTEETTSKPPVFLIPGISNDVDCVGNLVHELAMEGRQVIVVGYPESFKGQTTEAFADAVAQDEGYRPHADFFKAALDHFYKKNEDIELWGLSTGAPIAETILEDPIFQQRVENAVLLCPASCVDQSVTSLKLGLLHDIGFMREPGTAASLSWTTESKTPREKDQKELRKKVFKSLLKKITKKLDYWKGARVKEGGSIVVLSGQQDKVTKSSEAVDLFLENPQIRVIDLPDGYHATPGVEPEKVLPKIFETQKAV